MNMIDNHYLKAVRIGAPLWKLASSILDIERRWVIQNLKF